MNHSTPLHVIAVGHVDHGKSTLLGRLLYDTDSLSDEQKRALQLAELDAHSEVKWASLLDAFLEEQAQNITIDTTQLIFRTPQRSYVMIDAPGHQEFLKNMIAGATRADAALLIVDVAEGIKAQTEQHLQLLSLLGIKQVIVLLNKMDLVHRAASFFEKALQEIEQLFQQYELCSQQTIPIVACSGENIVMRSSSMNWYQGPTLLEALEKVAPAPSLEMRPLRFIVQDVYRFDERRLVVGRLESGRLCVGEEIVFWPGQKKSRIRSIEEWGTTPLRKSAVAGESIALTLEEPLFIERGYVGSSETEPPREGVTIQARLFWLDKKPLLLQQTVTLQLGTQRVEGRVERIADPKQHPNHSSSKVAQYDIVDLLFYLADPLIYDVYEEIAPMGRFAVVIEGELAGGGIILKRERATDTKTKSDHLTWSLSPINRAMRKKQFGHPGAVLWLTGLSGSGKSTLAQGLESLLHQRGMATVILDGDNLRHGLCSDLGFSLQDRSENMRRTGEVAKLFAEAGLIALCALISPFESDRARVKRVCLQDGIIFKEIFVDAPLEVCEARDPRGLYQKARRKEIEQFTGISSPYEVPAAADLHLMTATASSQETIQELYETVLIWLSEEPLCQT
jgi:bifunctional enzyme CysN/CysC